MDPRKFFTWSRIGLAFLFTAFLVGSSILWVNATERDQVASSVYGSDEEGIVDSLLDILPLDIGDILAGGSDEGEGESDSQEGEGTDLLSGLINLPETPIGLVVKDLTIGRLLEIRWEPFANPDVTYNLYRSTDLVDGYQLIAKDLQEPVYVDRDVRNEENYFYKIVAVIDGVESILSDAVAGIPTRDKIPPRKIEGLEISLSGLLRTLSLTWEPSDDLDVVGYNLYRGTPGKGELRKVNHMLLQGTTWMDSGLTHGGKYRYYVTAVDLAGNESPPSKVGTYEAPIEVVGAVGEGYLEEKQEERAGFWKSAFLMNGIRENGNKDIGSLEEQLFGPRGVAPLEDGGWLVADTFNGRIVEIYGNEIDPIPVTFMEPTGVEMLRSGHILVVDSQANTVYILDNQGDIIWQFGGDGELNLPFRATEMENGNILIADRGNHRVIEVHRNTKKVVWQYGQTGEGGLDPGYLSKPASVQETNRDGRKTILVADSGNHRVVEIDYNTEEVVWEYGQGTAGKNRGFLDTPMDARRLPNGNTLITDTLNYRVIEVEDSGYIFWQYGEEFGRTDLLYEPAAACVLPTGNVLVADQHNHRILELTH